MGKLTALEAKAKSKPGRYTDGNGLHLHVRAGGHRGWVFRFMRAGKLRDMGLGAFPEVTLAQAREQAQAARDHIKAGRDPITVKQQSPEAHVDRTFQALAERVIADRKGGWSHPGYLEQWNSTLATYVFPVIGDLHVQQVTTEHVLQVLRPIWSEKIETASRVRGRIEAILDAAKAMHWRTGENPARWKGHLATLLPKPTKVRQVEHHPSLPWRQLPAFLAALRGRVGSGARAIEFAILCGSRSGEVRGLTRRELDLDVKVWTIPAKRMKGRKVHRVPLSAAALAVLDQVQAADLKPGDLVFPGDKEGVQISNMTLSSVVRRMNAAKEGQPVPWVEAVTGEPITVHGFRSTFRVWAGEETTYSRELIEAALAHTVGNAVEAAYARTDLLERRRALMEDWGRACWAT